MIEHLKQPLWLRFSPHIIAQAGIVALATAYYAQLVYGLEPCILCLYQRIPFGFAIGLGLIGMFRPALLVWVLPLAGLAFLAGSGIAFYHVGVEQSWWESTCAGDLSSQMSTTNLLQQLQMKPAKACDELEWTLFGISMASYNIPYSLGLAAFSFFGAYKLRG